MSIFIKDILLNGKKTSIYIDDNRIQEIGGPHLEADTVITGKNQAAIPGLINTHTHAAMTLFRGYADDMELFDWLSKKIWPLEAKLTPEDVYWGTRMACLEMIKSGTVCFNDMYWHMVSAAKAVADSGIRGVISGVVFDNFDPNKAKLGLNRCINEFHELKELLDQSSLGRIIPAYGPHAIYTVSNELLQTIAERARNEEYLIHIHLAETEKEVLDYLAKNGKRPVDVLSDLGFFGPDVIAAHGVWFNDKDISILGKHKVKVSHNPASNMKLSIGSAIRYESLTKAGVTVSLGTDGCASNNNLDMFESMKLATLLQKFHTNLQTVLPAHEVFKMATINGARTVGLSSGELLEGKLADIVLIDLKHPAMIPNHDLISNIVYSASGAVVRTTICDGKVLMLNRKVPGEEKVLENCQKHAEELMSR